MSTSAAQRAELRVNAVFHAVDMRHADQIAAEMVSRAHELANMPERECDVDVSIESVAFAEPGTDIAGAGRAGRTDGAGTDKVSADVPGTGVLGASELGTNEPGVNGRQAR